ncbi:hypothetical protein OFC51_36540, partial [Escherichia coli]|nr:hypothetical protein [Escherichia coli]
DDDSEGDNESEEFLYGVQGSCAADLRVCVKPTDPMDIKGQFWNDDDSEGDNESEEFLYGVQGSCAADL